MVRKMLDASFVRQDPRRVKQLGYEALARYMAHDSAATHAKIVTPAEAAAIADAGLGLVLVWEQGATDATWDAAAANAQADALGFPADRPIYYAADVDIATADYGRISDKLTGLPGRPRGIYGESGLVQFCRARGASHGWIAASSAWSHDAAPDAQLRQLVSGLVPGADENLILADDYGQHPIATEEDPVGNAMTMVAPQNYPDGRKHPHAGEVWVVDGLVATHVSSPHMIDVYRYVGVGGPAPIEAEWFDNLVLLPNSGDPVTTLPHGAGGAGGAGGGGASPVEIAKAVRAELHANPLD